MKTLKELIIQHDNDYGFDVEHVTQDSLLSLSSLSIVIPYYETGEVFSSALHYLYRAIGVVKQIAPYWQCEIIVVDDGSLEKKAVDYSGKELNDLRIVSNNTNQGRTKTRNHGLKLAQHELCLFMDSDVLVAEEFLLHHLRVHAFARKVHKTIITVGFFQFVDEEYFRDSKNKEIRCRNVQLNDFRLDCVYGPTWIGCEDDERFIGKRFKIVEETESFRKWSKDGFFGPWFLTNMVLGGFFMVDTESSKEVNGFDDAFGGYGFTETSLPTKLIAGCGHFLVPVMQGGCLHIDDEKLNVSRKNKDKIFWEKHDFYFNRYLRLTWEQALRGYGKSETEHSAS
jgi:glycosyltransferase involved in cell wall biosynthesis